MKITTRIVQLPNFDKLRLGADGLGRAVMAGGQVIEAYAKINAEQRFSGSSTGGAGLAGSIQTVLTKNDGTGAEASVGPSVVYGRIQELGGFVEPVSAKALHFVIDGIEIFAKKVHIPPRPYLRPAADEHMSEIEAAVGAAIRNVMRRLA
jgi:hypothetical protein